MDRICILCDNKVFAKAMCKFCYNKGYKKKNHKRILKQNRERKREIRKTESGKEHMRNIHRKWYKKNRETNNSKRRKIYKNLNKKDLNKKKKMDKRHYEKNKVKILKTKEKYYKKNREKILETKKQYLKSPHGKLMIKLRNFKRDALLRKSKFKLNKKEMEEIYKRDKVCVYCGSSKNLGLDHIFPVSKGGKTIKKNIVLACWTCNSSKYNHNVIDWCNKKRYEVPKIINELI